MNDSNISLDRLFDVAEGAVNVGRALSNAFSDPQSINNSGYFNPMNDPQSRRNMGFAQQYPNGQGYGYGYNQQPPQNNGYMNQNQGFFNQSPQQNPGYNNQGYFSNNPGYYSTPGYNNPGYSNPGYYNGWGNDYQSFGSGASAGFTSESYGKYPASGSSSGFSNSSYNDDPFDHRIGGGYR